MKLYANILGNVRKFSRVKTKLRNRKGSPTQRVLSRISSLQTQVDKEVYEKKSVIERFYGKSVGCEKDTFLAEYI
jgi:hypothetical protein